MNAEEILKRVLADEISEDDAVALLSELPAGLNAAAGNGARASFNSPSNASGDTDVRARLTAEFSVIAGGLLKVAPSEIDPRQAIADYGLNSVIAAEFIQALHARLGIRLSPTVFFEHDNLSSVVNFIHTQFPEEVARFYGVNNRAAEPSPEQPARAANAAHAVEFEQRPAAAAEGNAPPGIEQDLESLWAAASDADAPAACVSPACLSNVREAEAARTAQTAHAHVVVRTTEQQPDEVAIVGVACVMPGSRDVRAFWRNLMEGRDLVGEVPRSRLDEGTFERKRDDEHTRDADAGGFLDTVAGFDAEFFNVSPREAALMDPQQRLFLQTVWHALEDAGHKPSDFSGTRTGVYVGVATTDYQDLLVEHGAATDAFMTTGLAHAMLANRVSWALNLKGPTEPVNNSCASSLLAVHHAVRAIQAGLCDAAIAGGVNLILHSRVSDSFRKAGSLSALGRCRSFSERADGFVRGEGVGAVLLKPLKRALADGDCVYAVMRGAAIGHSGRSTTLTAPNLDAWVEVIVRAHRESGFDPRTISYVEAYGVGADLWDQVEIRALGKAFQALGPRGGGACGVGSVKSNVGSLETASGMAALAKVLMAMRHGKLPPTLHLDRVNPFIELEGTPFNFVTRPREWERPRVDGVETPRRAGVSAFSFGGVNAHLALEEYRDVPAPPSDGSPCLFVLSARDDEALKTCARTLVEFLEERLREGEAPAPERIAFTLQAGREAWECRLALVARDLPELMRKLDDWLSSTPSSAEIFTGRVPTREVLAQRTTVAAEDALRNATGDAPDWHEPARAWVAGRAIDWSSFHRRPLKRVSLPGYTFRQKRFWFTPGGRNGVAHAPRASLDSSPASFLDGRADWLQLDRARYDESVAELEHRSRRLLLDAFRRMGVFQRPGERHELRGLPERLGVADDARPVFNQLLDALETAGYVRRAGGVVETTALVVQEVIESPRPAAIARQLKLAEGCAAQLPELLRGEVTAPEVLFPDSSTELVEEVYGDDTIAGPFNEAVARITRAFVESRLGDGAAGAARVLEVGAGTGGTSRKVWNLLSPFGARISYAFTDISPSLLRRARGRFSEKFPFASFDLFDAERDPAAQGFAEGGFDLVIASNVLHTTRDLPAALSNLRGLLGRGGCLLINEVSPGGAFLSLTFGLLAGWRRFEDEQRRAKGRPLLTAPEWFEVLRETGFEPCRAYGDRDSLEDSTQCVIVAARTDAPAASAEPQRMTAANEPRRASEPVPAARHSNDGGRFEFVLEQVACEIGELLETTREALDVRQPFSTYGLDSFLAVELITRLKSKLGVQIKATALFDYSTIHDLARHVEQKLGDRIVPDAMTTTESAPEVPAMTPSEPSSRDTNAEVVVRHGTDIAVVGMSGRFPDAPDLNAFWENLASGRCSIRPVPAQRWPAHLYYDADPRKTDKTYCVEGGFLEDVDLFDAEFFGMTGKEAALTDPQHRLFLEEAWGALEDAGYATAEMSGARCGVFVGAGSGDYLTEMQRIGAEQGAHAFWGNTASVMASRLSYFLNLKGVSVAVETACSSSLVAVHLACQSILAGESETAVAGGVFVSIMPTFHVLASNARMLSPVGRCKTFDQSADGFVPGEGVGAVVLKRLDAALRDGDYVRAVIKGSGVNQDGRTNGITAPSVSSQAELLRAVYERFRIDPETITYVEAHGTGTKLGDPIEIEALSRAFGASTNRGQFCAVGSVKTNIGHTATAAGIAGLLKTLLALDRKQLPPSLHFEQPNEHIDFAGSQFFVNTRLGEWRSDGPRRAAVSSFGFGGTNAHLVVEEAPPAPRRDDDALDARLRLFPISARDEAALRASVERFAGWLTSRGADYALGDIAHTLQSGRMHFAHRVAFLAEDREGLKRAAEAFLNGGHSDDVLANAEPAGRAPERAALKELLESLTRELESDSMTPARRGEKLRAVADLYVNGYAPDWRRVNRGDGRRVPLPGYPFQRRRYWLEPAASAAGWDVPEPARAAEVEDEGNVYYAPVWTPRPLTGTTDGREASPLLIFDDSDALAGALRRMGERVLLARPGDAFEAVAADEWRLNPEAPEHYTRLLSELEGKGLPPRSVVLLWPPANDDERASKFTPSQAVRPAHLLSRALLRVAAGREVQLLCVYDGTKRAASTREPAAASMAALGRSLKSLSPRLRARYVRLPESLPKEKKAEALLAELRAHDSADEVEYAADGSRRVRLLAELDVDERRDAEDDITFEGAWVITGGAGALGRSFARHLAGKRGVKLALIGRAAPDAARRELIETLERAGAQAVYLQADVTDEGQLALALARVRETYGPPRGVIHAAGTITARLLGDKTVEEFEAVLKAKMDGAALLDELTADDPLNYFVLISSAASVLGDFGQCDYGIANRFLDAFASHRERLRGEGRRRGRTLSINWPLWNMDGMRFDAERERAFQETTGLRLLDAADALEIFERLLRLDVPQVMALRGRRERIRRTLAGFRAAPHRASAGAAANVTAAARTAGAELSDAVAQDLRGVLASSFGLDPLKIGLDDSLGDFGLDSVMLTEFAEKLSARYRIELDPTVFYNRPDLRSLAAYLLETHADAAAHVCGDAGPDEPLAPMRADASDADEQPADEPSPELTSNRTTRNAPLAVVGMSGAFPQSADLEEFWANIAAERCLIAETPAERWDWRSFAARDGRERTRWLGAVPRVDGFDARFFKTTPLDAELMDPQQRLFLEHCWRAIEDAGYRASELKGQRVGVFVGAQFTDYRELLREHGVSRPQAVTGNAETMIANRVSYFFDFHGPSEVINTACSSSLVALHRALTAIRAGACDWALVGGVSLVLHPNNVIAADELGVLSPEGRCKTLDASADGYVKGEGVGVVLVRPLESALRGRDHVRALIRGVAVNHGGKANSLTAPSSESQAELLFDAFREAGVSPAEMTFVEMHGTGTKLGDPVEVDGLKLAFERAAAAEGVKLAEGYCGLGSVKTNIGHLEPAAGIAGLIKTILSMNHGLLPGNPNLRELNPYLRLDGSPFYVVRGNAAWARPKDAAGNESPRLAGVSSFGFGGSNAHAIVEEAPARRAHADDSAPKLLVLSATDDERLTAYADSVLSFLRRRAAEVGGAAFSLRDFAFTLQTGREPLEARLAVIASTAAEAVELFELATRGKNHHSIFRGNAREGTAGQADEKAAAAPTEAKDYAEVARRWVAGARVRWEDFYTGVEVYRTAAPTYPFRQTRYWLDSFVPEGRAATEPLTPNAVTPSRTAAIPSADVTEAFGALEEKALSYGGDEVGLEILDGGIALVTMKDARHRNMFSEGLVLGLLSAFRRIRESAGVKVVVLTNEGPTFAMGGTQEGLLGVADGSLRYTDLPFFYEGLLRCHAPTIVAMRGHAGGAGFVFGLYADIVVMAEECVYTTNFMKFGVTPGMGATYILREKLGRQLASEMMLSARAFTGAELKGRGASFVFAPRDRALDEALSTARLLSAMPDGSLRLLKQTLAADILAVLPQIVAAEVEVQRRSFAQPEVRRRIEEHFRKHSTWAVRDDVPHAASAPGNEADATQAATDEPARADAPVRVRLRPKSDAAASVFSSLEPPRVRLQPREARAASQVGESLERDAVTPGDAERRVTEKILSILEKCLRLGPSDVDLDVVFSEMGVDSINAVEMMRDLNAEFSLALDASVVYDFPTVRQLARKISADARPEPRFISATPDAPAEAAGESRGRRAEASHVIAPEETADVYAPVSSTEVEDALAGIICRVVHFAPSELDRHTTFADMGVDSIGGVEITRELNAAFGLKLDAAALYDHSTLPSLAALVCAEVAKSRPAHVRRDPPPAAPATVEAATEVEPAARTIESAVASPAESRAVVVSESRQSSPPAHGVWEPIAVVGMSGRFPGAESYTQFWENLAAGVCSVTEPPAERGWDVGSFFDPDHRAAGKSYSKWGGFLKDVDKFDPAFFNISRHEAEIMSPEQRLYLMESWRALEDAGYTDERLAGLRCGVFVGVNAGDYPKIVGERYTAHALTGLSPCVLASRISYFLNLRGPSMAVDTACSSSLVAINQACQSIIFGDCDVALAGGVWLMLTPDILILSSKAGMLSPTGRCAAFDASADGIVLGEAVGAVVLKRLSRAIEDGDYIHGVIRSIGVNQDGKTNGISAPSSHAQAALEEVVCRRGAVDPADVTYVEAHGTGTHLGDPIELKALRRVFGAAEGRGEPCALGSAKTNVGHTNTAAGVVGLIKVLLSLKQRQLPPSLNYEALNPNIVPGDDFRVNTKLRDWLPPDGRRRVAALSSFGFSGTNAHAVIEEHREARLQRAGLSSYVFVVSGKTPEAHDRRVAELAAWLRNNPEAAPLDVSYTLCVGRTHFAVRSAFVASNLEELSAALEAVTRGEASPLHRSDAAGEKIAQELADLYARGLPADFERLFDGTGARRIPLPTYPFAAQRCWVEAAVTTRAQARTHPLLDGPDLAASLSDGAAFIKFVAPGEPVVDQHRVLSHPILPGVAYLEAVLAAASNVYPGRVRALSDVAWLHPMEIGGDGVAYRVVLRRADGQLHFEVTTGDAEPVVHARGKVELDATPAPVETLSPEEIKSRCTRSLDAEDIYDRYSVLGVDYGPYFRTLRRVWGSETEALGELVLAAENSAELSIYTLHPALLDGALQAIAGFVVAAGEEELMLPFALERIEVHGALAPRVYAHLRREEGRRFGVRLLGEAGELLVRIEGVTLRPWRDPLRGMFYAPRWVERPVPQDDDKGAAHGTVLALVPPGGLGLGKAAGELHPSAELYQIVLGRQSRHIDARTREVEASDSSALGAALREFFPEDAPDVVYHLGGVEVGDDSSAGALEASQQRGVFTLFRLAKALDARGDRHRRLRLCVVTNDVHQFADAPDVAPFAASLQGFAKSLAQEFKYWEVSCIDLSLKELEGDAPAEARRRWLRQAASEPVVSGGADVAMRAGRRYVMELEPIELSPRAGATFKRGGTYFIVGGAGGIGYQLSRHLAAEYQARLVWVGRREEDAHIREQMREVERLGGEALYVSADASDAGALGRAVERARSRFGRLDGAVHSALDLRDRTVQQMDEATLAAALRPKAHGVLNMYAALAEEALDFFMLFSSAQSFAGTAGQANYAAGCCFEDAWGNYLRRRAAFPVYVINWGYWGDVGVVANQETAERMAAVGIQPIRPAEGIQAIHRVLQHGVGQVMVIRAALDTRRRLGLEARGGATAERLPFIDEGELAVQLRTRRALNRLSGWRLLAALKGMGFFERLGEGTTADELRRSLGIHTRYARLWAALLDISERRRFVVRRGDDVLPSKHARGRRIEAVLSRLDDYQHGLLEKYPSLRPHARLLERCLQSYPEVLAGYQNASEVLFPHGSLELVAGLYSGNRLADFFNELTAAAVKTLVARRLSADPERVAVVLEVGAGTGGTSSFVLEALAGFAPRVRYVYTDISKRFTEHGKEQFRERFPFVEFGVLNIEEPDDRAPAATSPADVIIGANVLHASRNLDAVLRRLRGLLVPGGSVVLSESTEAQDFATMTFGLTGGWWLYDDEDRRIPHSPLASENGWRRLLEANGFSNVVSHGAGDSCGQAVFVATCETRPTPERAAGLSVSGNGSKLARPAPAGDAAADFEAPVRGYVKRVFAEVLKEAPAVFDDHATFETFGVDSLISQEIIYRFEADLGPLPATLLFENMTVAALAARLAATHAAKLEELLGRAANGHAPVAAGHVPPTPGVNLSPPNGDSPQRNGHSSPQQNGNAAQHRNGNKVSHNGSNGAGRLARAGDGSDIRADVARLSDAEVDALLERLLKEAPFE